MAMRPATVARDLVPLLLASVTMTSVNRPCASWLPPTGQLRVIETDAANRADDQYALAVGLGSPNRCFLEAVIAAHFGEAGGVSRICKPLEIDHAADSLLKHSEIPDWLVIFCNDPTQWSVRSWSLNVCNDILAPGAFSELLWRFALFDTATFLRTSPAELEKRFEALATLGDYMLEIPHGAAFMSPNKGFFCFDDVGSCLSLRRFARLLLPTIRFGRIVC